MPPITHLIPATLAEMPVLLTVSVTVERTSYADRDPWREEITEYTIDAVHPVRAPGTDLCDLGLQPYESAELRNQVDDWLFDHRAEVRAA